MGNAHASISPVGMAVAKIIPASVVIFYALMLMLPLEMFNDTRWTFEE